MAKNNAPSPNREPQSDAPLSLEELAERQGVRPVTEFDTLLGRSSPEDESAEEFAVLLRSWRNEGTPQASRK